MTTGRVFAASPSSAATLHLDERLSSWSSTSCSTARDRIRSRASLSAASMTSATSVRTPSEISGFHFRSFVSSFSAIASMAAVIYPRVVHRSTSRGGTRDRPSHHASRVWAKVSPPSRTSHPKPHYEQIKGKSPSSRDATTNTRDAYAPQSKIRGLIHKENTTCGDAVG